MIRISQQSSHLMLPTRKVTFRSSDKIPSKIISFDLRRRCWIVHILNVTILASAGVTCIHPIQPSSLNSSCFSYPSTHLRRAWQVSSLGLDRAVAPSMFPVSLQRVHSQKPAVSSQHVANFVLFLWSITNKIKSRWNEPAFIRSFVHAQSTKWVHIGLLSLCKCM